MKLLWPILTLALGACTGATGDDVQNTETRAAALESAACWTQSLAWGTGGGELGLLPRGDEQVARGPQAVAVADSGEVFVLDSENGRVLGLTASATRTVVTGLARDAEDLAIGPDGAIAVHSPLQARVWVFDPDGAPAGEVLLPRSFRSLVGISLSNSRDIILRSAHQETYSVGSPAAPKDLPTMLGQKREGAYERANGTGVSVAVRGGQAELHLLRSSGGRSQTSDRLPIPGDVSGANLVGLTGDVTCLRLERVTQSGEAIKVDRRAHCIDLSTRTTVYESPLPSPGVYKPRHELALGGTSPVLATLKPGIDGMAVESCEVVR